ncbi:MAG: DUF885 domain-containing protein [Massilia sp.]
MRKLFAICVFVFAPLASAASGVPSPAATADQQARALFDADWQWTMQHQPELATCVGDYRFDATLADTSLAASLAANFHARAMLDQARAIERERLTGQNQLSYDLFIYDHQRTLKAAGFYPYTVQPITAHSGIHLSFAQLVAQMPFADETGYRNYLARIAALPRHIDGLMEQLRENMRSGWAAPKAVMRPLPGMLRQMRESLVAGPLGQPFRQIPGTIAKPVRDELAQAGPAALLAKAAPALQKLEDFIRTEYLPAARDTIAASSLPGGSDYYSFLAAGYTSPELGAAEIHALGLREVARIRAEMTAVIAQTGFGGSFKEFAAFANADPRLFFGKPEPLLARYRRMIERAAAGLPKLFVTVPDEEIVVKAAPPEQPLAAYYEATADGRPAALVVNTARLDAHPLWAMDTVVLHETWPGHHLQTARAHALADLPEFRRFGWYVAFGEGWAMYAETLGSELGFYRDPFSRFGQLNSELFRAARLVVDTGIHARGWSRQQALDYLNTNTANAPSDNEIEIDRYIAWPGQALGYKIGQLKISALRQKAQSALGERFDLRRFHQALLDNGPLPMGLLEQQIKAWTRAQQP